ncbi:MULTISPECIES: cyclopropane fatty acyl phospholipid synthase [Serratia]|jgi:cyclopropane-fatty-acyl-phospholipid synthase|uniref:Cyclopropane-fatty-acyl-phospholipid synthase n=1 Tax=Serratia fonticola TaxID=47917 RepID=A0A3S4WVN2_SERFO|nr:MULTISPECIES: cyclopropane fatty acyl phospholipid synthase [Serratia]AYM91799.1 cyclopropane fatty acyl phospholipid synthase [Serratia sp. 3ACOL1]MBL5861730.1 cyclopropane fatty acyl phospholipid synthase [Serratia fonticola]MDK2377309.1 cyclopropane fatty acyl phospholipid synthase [Serratia fonticola]CAI0832284.1 Cyclopropane-fatty-acyl-phospholipid synthase [Serratia fonticola]CAI0992286.1 Cyclopropane-fatty-acyl-phospholipid synthase [Serratia fonticola]
MSIADSDTRHNEANPWNEICRSLLTEADIIINGHRPFDIQVHNQNFFKRVLKEGSLGLGESYMDGWWDCEQLDEFINRIMKADLRNALVSNFKDVIRIMSAKLFNLQSKKRAWIVGKEHYDLGNDLFDLMLDPWMQYSCGYWHTSDDLFQAQEDKLRLICEKLQLAKGMTLLDIGCGWGGLAEYAAKNYGVKVTGITISEEQKKSAEERCKLQDVEIMLKDYRDLDMQFDRIVSVGMFEHVGPKNYNDYFNVVNKNLKPQGIFLLHTIGSNESSNNVDPWINKYIFPNGCLPSILQISNASESKFVLEDLHNFGTDYDKTLMAWHQRFELFWPEIEEKYSERFYRMFSYYLKSCAGAFRSRNIQLWQFVFTRGIDGGLRVTR